MSRQGEGLRGRNSLSSCVHVLPPTLAPSLPEFSHSFAPLFYRVLCLSFLLPFLHPLSLLYPPTISPLLLCLFIASLLPVWRLQR